MRLKPTRRVQSAQSPIANPIAAAKQAHAIAAAHFDRLRTLPLKRISLSALDPNRVEIDRVVTEMLGLPYNADTDAMLSQWRRLMCLQPAVNARNKKTLDTLAEAGIKA